MSSLDLEFDEPACDLLERRWFAVVAATRKLQTECDMLHEALQLADAAWRRSLTQLTEFEALGEALRMQMAGLDDPSAEPDERPRAVMSAA